MATLDTMPIPHTIARPTVRSAWRTDRVALGAGLVLAILMLMLVASPSPDPRIANVGPQPAPAPEPAPAPLAGGSWISMRP